ncbi:MAG TPA: hypothetical protein VKP60_16300 [Magnetospirillaceae bacterium]|nr:hypothetical protein [Magnetospirillaceae bacterium]
MVALAHARSERRKHSRSSPSGLIAEIRGTRYAILDISFGGMKLDGSFSVAGGLVDAVILPLTARGPAIEEKAEVRGRVERVEGELTAVRFSNVSAAMAKLIDGR